MKRKVGLVLMSPSLEGRNKRGAHDILVKNPVRPAIPLYLLGMDH